VIEAHRPDLEAFDLSKGTIRFSPERPIPDALVEAMVGERVRTIEAAGGR
jgi:uncharacterized protein YdhG (YjbR/CyaY superfamily)